ncbi:Neutral ceramidase precursor [Maioricimonas rarisocia]|uniref:Neutral ceramidase n=1 Tax=Maioricimonas rarisocia TaxID=2528026 RepID=A0A517Z6N7_9PLAN|nr:neutral/alkaline non-lysosomal ceramidase N-terminal domain-containing protein [Maioricimonas rarisocia]QDU38153.1 Neutral ceramidase precursor [Maioricimonas rarisocia]
MQTSVHSSVWGLVMLLSVAAMPARAELKVGAAAVDITPQIGTPMAGYYNLRASEGVHDPLHAKVIVLDAGVQRAALIGLDLISTTQWMTDESRRLIEEQTGIPGDHVMLTATHAHTGPILSKSSRRYDVFGATNDLAVQYMSRLPDKIAEGVRTAVERLEPATVSTASGVEEQLAFNRRFFMTDGSVGWNPGKLNPRIVREAGPVDPEVPVVYFADADGNPLATYVNYAMHLDTVGGTQFSADAPATLAGLLAAVKGDSMVTLFTPGCCGDVNHVNVRSSLPQKGPEEAARIGTHLAANVLRSYERLEPVASTPLRIRREVVELPLPEVSDADFAAAEETLRRFKDPGEGRRPPFREVVNAFKVVDVVEREGRPFEVEVQTIALGDSIAWVSLPGEIFTELGITIKQGSPFDRTIVAELSNGSIGYIPNREAYPQGEYEVISARCAAGSGEILVDTALDSLRELYAEHAAQIAAEK